MDFNPGFEEQEAASVVAALSGKRMRDGADAAGGFNASKFARISIPAIEFLPEPQMHAVMAEPLPRAVDTASSFANSEINSTLKLRDSPYFYYQDFSLDEDPDPLTPLTPPGRVPNFPAKMHAILSRPDFTDVIAWMPHGRSWRVLKPREFEVRVLPTFFEHSKFSSFIRQANGWGFRRITQGRDRNSYYHELFLRGLPHLCKQMKRPGVSEKRPADVDHEPELYAISEAFPVPEKADDDSIMLECTIKGGPKARMPIYTGATLSPESFRLIHGGSDNTNGGNHSASILTPKDQSSLFSFHNSISASDNQICMHNPQEQLPPAAPVHSFFMAQNPFMNHSAPMQYTNNADVPNNMAYVMPMQHLAFHAQPVVAPDSNNVNYQSSSAASQFAAGFAAATALSSSHIRNVLGQALAVNQSFQQFQQQTPMPLQQGAPQL